MKDLVLLFQEGTVTNYTIMAIIIILLLTVVAIIYKKITDSAEKKKINTIVEVNKTENEQMMKAIKKLKNMGCSDAVIVAAIENYKADINTQQQSDFLSSLSHIVGNMKKNNG